MKRVIRFLEDKVNGKMRFQTNKNKYMFCDDMIFNCKWFWTWIFKLSYTKFNALIESSRRINAMSVCWLIQKADIEKVLISDGKTKPTGIYDQFVTFINIWPASQWIWSLITLVLMYWIIGAWYNKKLARQGGWISWQTRVIMIFIDLILNLALGIYYMAARDTMMGAIMLRCPIAISPLIFLIEFLVFVWYYKTYVLVKKDKS